MAPEIDVNNSVPPTDAIAWSKWDSLDSRRLLILGYHGGAVQLWDVTDLDAVYEVLNLASVSTGPKGDLPRSALIFPSPFPGPSSGGRAYPMETARPLLGVLMSTAELVVYSLASHSVVRRLSVIPASPSFSVADCNMQASERFITINSLVCVISTAVVVCLTIMFSIEHNIQRFPPYNI